MKRVIKSAISADKFPLVYDENCVDNHDFEIRKEILTNNPQDRTFRWMQDSSGKYYIWPANFGTHDEYSKELGINIKDAGIGKILNNKEKSISWWYDAIDDLEE